MAGVDLLDNGEAMYQINIKGNEMLVPHFTNYLGILMAAA